MRKERFNYIKRKIYRDIKPKNCRVIYIKFPFRGVMGLWWPKNNTCYISIKKNKTNIDKIHTILHEICHSITLHKTNKQYSMFMKEYMAEKLLRQICLAYGWNDILERSNLNIYAWTKNNNFFPQHASAARRIIREEGP